MKTTIKRRAKSVLAVLLTLCLVMSVFTIGTISVAAYSTSDNQYICSAINSYAKIKMSSGGKNSSYTYNFYSKYNQGKLYYYFNDNSYDARPYTNDHDNGSYDYGATSSNSGKAFYINTNSTTLFPSSTSFYKMTVYWQPSGNNNNGYVFKADVAALTNMSPVLKVNNSTSDNQSSLVNTAISLGYTITSNSAVGTTTSAYQYRKGTTGSWTDLDSTTFTPTTAGDYYFKAVVTDGGVNTSTNALLARTEESNTLKVTVKTKLTKPTFLSTTVSSNVGTAATLTVDNHSTIKGQDSNVTYVLKKGGTTLTSPTDYTFDNSTGVFTLKDTTSAAAGTYTVQAIAADTTNYSNSDVSSPATVTVYSPSFCLVGNDIRDGAITIGDTTPDRTAPTGTDTYWNTWQENYKIGTATDTPGVYRLTFTVKEEADYEWSVELGIMMKDVGQKAFILDGDAYNTSSHGDLIVPDAGIADSNNLYAYELAATNAGGALVLKHGQTYTITIDQTQRYDESSPYGKITITATDAYADTIAKKKSYNATDREWESVTDAASTIGTASAAPVHGTKGSFSTTLTATVVNSHYQFVGWYSDADCTTQVIAASACNKTGNTYTKTVSNISESTTYYAYFEEIQPTDYAVAITQPVDGTVSFTGGVASTGTSATTAYQGATVALSAALNHGKEFVNWKIVNTSNGADVTSLVLNANATAVSGDNVTGSFTMPGYAVTVTADLKDKTPVTITRSSNNNNLGTAAYTAGTYYIGDTVTITATPVGGVFKNWTATGATLTSATSASTTIKINASTVTIRAVFDYKTYELFSDEDTAGNTTYKTYPMIRQSDGTYVSTRTVSKDTGAFTIYDVSADKYGRPQNSTNNYELHSGYTSMGASMYEWVSGYNTASKAVIKSTDSASYYVKYDPTTQKISILSVNPMGTIAPIYAKDGTIRYSADGDDDGDLWTQNSQASGEVTCQKGVTTVKRINSTAVSNPDTSRYPSTNPTLTDHLKIYSAPIGSTITIETEVRSAYAEQGFYVGMFVVNGWKVAASDMGNGVYTATYTLSDEYAVPNLGGDGAFEITPVYYNKNFDYVTFYVDSASVPSAWGNTISTCADYKGMTTSHFEGSYPGQPLGREGDLYEIKVAKYYYDAYNSTTGTWTKHPNDYPSATITAYNYDNVHHYYFVEKDETLNTGNKNYQTYDYSDFAYLAQIDKVEAILFRCMPESSKTNRDYCGVNQTLPSDSNVNTYKLLTDYYGNPIDALGNKLTGDALTNALSGNPTPAVKIVSCGNISNDNKKSDSNNDVAYKNWRTKANWITAWKVFDVSDSKQIAVGTPADFIDIYVNNDSHAAQYNMTYTNSKTSADLLNKVTFISYEKELTNNSGLSGVNNDTGQRIDGQWYYSAQHDFDSTVKVAYTASRTSTVTNENTTIETDTNSANNTGYIGATSGTKATLDGKTTQTYSNVTTEAALKCTVGSGYTFVGWYIYDGSTYTKINDNFANQNTTMLMKKNYTIIAVVRAVGEGDLVITHSRYTGSSPTGHDGTGKYYVSAVVIHSDNTETAIDEAQNSITVSGLLATDKLKITLRTVCNGTDTFYAWYEEALGAGYTGTGKYYEICDENVDPLGLAEASYTFFAADCSTFFDGDDLKRKTIDLYSDIVHVSASATLTYKYYDRFATSGKNQMVSYVVKNVPLNREEIANNYIPSDATISKYAPNVVDTIYTDTKWTITGTKVQRESSSVTLMATQAPKTCFVLYLPNDVVGANLLKSATTETPVTDVVAWNSRTVDYNSWLINADADMDNPQESDFYVNAPLTYTYNETTWNFVRFDVYSYDRTTGNTGEIIFSSNDNYFGYRIYADCVIYPVYTTGTVANDLTAVIEPAVLNREVYGDSTSATDRLYADLIVSYINASTVGGCIPEVIRDNDPKVSGYSIETGVILDKTVNLTDVDFEALKSAAVNGTTDDTATRLANYTGFVNEANVTALAQDNTACEGLTKYVNDNTKLTNKNRLDKVFRYTNTEAAQKRVFAAYSYVVITNTSTGAKTVAISKPQKFNFCYLGNKPLAEVSE